MNTRDLGMGSGAGKGDSDRSPGWREHYDEIDWHRDFVETDFVRKGGRLVKRYGALAAPQNLDAAVQDEHEFRMGL